MWPICKTKSISRFLNSELIVSQAPKHGSADIIILAFVLFSKNSTNLEKWDFKPSGSCKTTFLYFFSLITLTICFKFHIIH